MRKVLIVGLGIASLALVACGKDEPTQVPAPVQQPLAQQPVDQQYQPMQCPQQVQPGQLVDPQCQQYYQQPIQQQAPVQQPQVVYQQAPQPQVIYQQPAAQPQSHTAQDMLTGALAAHAIGSMLNNNQPQQRQIQQPYYQQPQRVVINKTIIQPAATPGASVHLPNYPAAPARQPISQRYPAAAAFSAPRPATSSFAKAPTRSFGSTRKR